MRLAFATERLIAGELSDHVSITAKPYGRTICVCAFGVRLIVDLITRRL